MPPDDKVYPGILSSYYLVFFEPQVADENGRIAPVVHIFVPGEDVSCELKFDPM